MDIGTWKDSRHVEPKDLPPINVNDDQKIEEIDIFDPRYHTTAGVSVGMKISEAEKKYGQFKEMFWLTGFGEAGGFTKQPNSSRLFSKLEKVERRLGLAEGRRLESHD